MKTLKQVLSERKEYARLIKAVINRVGLDSVEDINNHGIDGGFNGFIYTADTVKFFKNYKKEIMQLAEEMSESMGEDMLTMIASFGCLKDNGQHTGKVQYSPTEIGQAIFNGKGEYADQIQNAMAWFAAEEVCRMFEE